MAGNSFGQLFRVTTFGESHGPAIGCVIDGTPPGLKLSESDIQPWLDKRRPGQSKFTTQRREKDQVRILSGVFEGITTGTPIALLIENTDARSKDYDAIKDKFRPGHADYAYLMKYGVRDYRGSGRASARETATRVAAGAIERANWDWRQIDKNPFWCPDKKMAAEWAAYLDGVRKQGSSAGAVIEIQASGVPAGLGEPIYGKLDGDLAAALMSINAVKGVEIGNGFAAAALQGEQNADEMRAGRGKNAKPRFLSNNAGGILGGISTGQDVVARFAVKPTSSIATPMRTVTTKGRNTTVSVGGRHDPCVGIRAVPVGEAMMAIVLADHLLRHRALGR